MTTYITAIRREGITGKAQAFPCEIFEDLSIRTIGRITLELGNTGYVCKSEVVYTDEYIIYRW